jgi:predicted DCC family thiol-disulfide oxidoreductase YuxK
VTARQRRGGRRRSHRPDQIGTTREAVLVFDGDCGFCTSSARWLERGFRHGERAEAWQLLGDGALAELGLTTKDAKQAAWWVDREGRRERGHRAAGRALEAAGGWRRGAGRLILTPPTSWLAAGAYRLVVRWRHRLPGGTPACRLDQEERKAAERLPPDPPEGPRSP